MSKLKPRSLPQNTPHAAFTTSVHDSSVLELGATWIPLRPTYNPQDHFGLSLVSLLILFALTHVLPLNPLLKFWT